MLTNSDLVELTAFRRDLHRRPEISGEEVETARTIVEALKALNPSRIVQSLGGHGVAGTFDSGKEGPTILFRAELDALPIEELCELEWKSEVPGKGHLCGHDGHMTMLLALGRLLTRNPIDRGRVVLMFQPAEEDGSGARAVVADQNFDSIKPDWAFAIHNEPGRPLGYVSIRSGLMNCASQGLQIRLSGKTAHAAEPHEGLSPAIAVANLIPKLRDLGQGGELNEDFRLATITHIQIGEPTFGVSPADAVINATLRTTRDEALEDMVTSARALAQEEANAHGLTFVASDHDVFAASINHPDAVEEAVAAMDALGIPNGDFGLPMRASEDFGVFGWNAKSAMLCLGSGDDCPALHNPDFDFPDDLIPIGASIFERIARDLLAVD